eukprot:2851790-Pyramimonas_sp.AAC.1
MRSKSFDAVSSSSGRAIEGARAPPMKAWLSSKGILLLFCCCSALRSSQQCSINWSLRYPISALAKLK